MRVKSLPKSARSRMPASADDINYDSSYYENYNGKAYGRTTEWLSFFDKISKKITELLAPQTVLDLGCAYGLLVETLRDRGVQAFGLDISEYAINQAREDLKDFLRVGSMLEPIKGRYDLIISIEVIEHIEEKHSDAVIHNMCTASDQILLATTPDDFDDPTHFNVQPPLYWVQKFAQFGFVPDITFDASFLTPYAILFRKNHEIKQIEYTRLYGLKKLQDLYFSRVTHERNLQSIEIKDLQHQIEEQKASIQERDIIITKSNSHIENLQEALATETRAREYYQNTISRIQSSLLWKLSTPLRLIGKIRRAISPLIPQVIAKTNDLPILECDTASLRGWGMFFATLESDDPIILKLNAKTRKRSDRVVAVPIIEKGKKRAWMFRNKAEFDNFSAEITYGQVNEVKFLKMSTALAVIFLIIYRWKIGHGFKAGLSLFVRCLRHLVKVSPRGIFEEIWPQSIETDQQYENWLGKFDKLDMSPEITAFVSRLKYRPKISIILPTYNSDLKFLAAAIKSVEVQSYDNWQLCIADDGSSDVKLKKYLKSLEPNPKINIVYHDKNRHISEASNSAIELATGEFLAFLDHDDQLHPHALTCVVSELNRDKHLDLIYTDEDKVDEWGNRTNPNFKSDWNPDLLLSQNYICHLTVYRASLVKKIGGLRKGFEGAQDYDLLLRFTEVTTKISHLPLVLYHWRTIEGSTARASGEKNYAHNRAEKALTEAISRRNLNASVMPSGCGVFHRVKYEINSPEPLVSIIIPTRDRIELVKICIDGIINKTNYTNWEILIIDNDSVKKESEDFFNSIQSDKIRVIKFPGQFNYSAINNFGASHSKGEILLLLNNDIEVIHQDWMTELVSHSQRPEVGAVGARLYYSDDHVQHDGIIIGIGGVAGYANPRMKRSDIGPFGGGRLIRNYSAVTAAVLAIKKDIYDEVNGLDEENLKVAFNDVDFCLRVVEAGYRNIYTPYCELYHHESLSRGPDIGSEKAKRFEKEVLYMRGKWSKIIHNDPYYNPNFSLSHGFSLDVGRGESWPWNKVD